MCIAQTDLQAPYRLQLGLAMGYVIRGIRASSGFGVLDDQSKCDSAAMAFNGATMQMFNHGLITGALFFLVGVIHERAHSAALDRFAGLASRRPITTASY